MSKVKQNLTDMFSKLDEYVSTKTVVGEPVVVGDVILIPLVDVTLGMGSAMIANTDEKDTGKEGRDGGGGAFGAKMTPSAVVVVTGGTVQLVNIKNQESVNKLLDMVPGILSKFNLDKFFKKEEKDLVLEDVIDATSAPVTPIAPLNPLTENF